jgi:hypothetical protein
MMSAIASAVGSDGHGAISRLTITAPTNTLGAALKPHANVAANAMPAGGHIGVTGRPNDRNCIPTIAVAMYASGTTTWRHGEDDGRDDARSPING